MSSLPATIHDMQRREFIASGDDDIWLMNSANEFPYGGAISNYKRLLSLSDNRSTRSRLPSPKLRGLSDSYVVIDDPSTGGAEVLITYDTKRIYDSDDDKSIHAHSLVERNLAEENSKELANWLQPASATDPVQRSDAHSWLQGFMQINQCKRLIDSLDSAKYSGVVDRLYFLLRHSRDKSHNQLLNEWALSSAIQTIASVQLLPMAIGMDDTGELEVIWENERTGASVTVDFLSDGTAWYDVELEDCEKSDTIDAIQVVSAISSFLI